MKKIIIAGVLALLLAGCGAQPVFETLGDIPVEGTTAQPRQILVELPGELTSPVLQSEELGTLYICDDYTVTLQTLPAGDLDGTLRQCTGYSAGELTVMTTEHGQIRRYDCAWSAAGEGESQSCRLAILDDGSYHYVLSVMAPAQRAGELRQAWQYLFDTFRIEGMDVPFSIGS